jgi:hydrogenase expression/formation protein HypC
MCIGVPLQVLECDEQYALCAAGGQNERLNVLLVGQQSPGTWLLAFRGSAVRVMEEDEALQTRAALAALDAALKGENTDRYFADLAGREPELPAHLRAVLKESQ